MKTPKKSILLVSLFICVILSSCVFFAAAGKKLSEYCPGLNIKLNGVSISTNNGREVTIVQYNDSWQKKVNAYFTDTANYFTGGNPRRYLDIKDGEDAVVANGDSILSRAIDKGNKIVTVIYNATTRKIIIVEDTDK